ncbi:MAG: adenosylmethionine--8-amino-7-oxononanoate transaminase [Planctomycetes bacterium]|nr:adenosylmethionine--8-amino-7-oxononanoate transaminase [Planctomycetota bacterium]
MPTTAKTRRLIELDRLHVWHPFTAMRQWRDADPLVIDQAQGFELIDTDGKRYIDGVSSLWCNVHGHRVPAIDKAIRDQLDKVAHTTLLGLGSEQSILLAAALAGRVPRPAEGGEPLTKVFYSDAGSTAVEAAIKMAVGYFHHTGRTGKRRFIGFRGGYHGDTTGSMSIGYSELFHRPFSSMVFPTTFAPSPDSVRLPEGLDHLHAMAGNGDGLWPSERQDLNAALRDHCLARLEEELKRHADEIAAVVIEPLMQGAAGMICQPSGFLRGVAALAKKYDVLLIADEVATGFGRTGRMFACEHEGVTPDILCLAKGISAGYLPLAATITTDRMERAFCGEYAENKTFFHGHTYTGNPLACAAALASLKLFDEGKLLERINRSAGIIADRLGALRNEKAFPHVIDIRQRGIMVGIELCRNRATREPFPSAQRTGAAVCMAMRSKGLIIRPLGDVLVLMPIPAMDDATLHRMLDTVVDMLRTWKV